MYDHDSRPLPDPVMYKNTYIEEAYSQLNDKRNYRKMHINPIPMYIQKINDLLKILLQKNQITPDEFEFMSPIDESKLGIFYTIPKIHKVKPENVRNCIIPGRPIVSNIGTPTEKISKFLNLHLSKLPPLTSSFIKDSKHFLQIIET